MPRSAHPGRGTATILPAALEASRRPAELSLTDTVDLLGTEAVQVEDPDTGQVTSTLPTITADVPARIEPDGQSTVTVTVAGDPSYVERWIVEIPHGTACTVDQYVDVTTSQNPQLQGARLRVTGELDSSTEPLRRLAAQFISRGEG